jgi:hypothetical protein
LGGTIREQGVAFANRDWHSRTGVGIREWAGIPMSGFGSHQTSEKSPPQPGWRLRSYRVGVSFSTYVRDAPHGVHRPSSVNAFGGTVGGFRGRRGGGPGNARGSGTRAKSGGWPQRGQNAREPAPHDEEGRGQLRGGTLAPGPSPRGSMQKLPMNASGCPGLGVLPSQKRAEAT